MMLKDFAEDVVGDAMTEKAIKQKWLGFCDALKELDTDAIRAAIEQGALDVFVEIEGDDGFGTEGMRL